LGTRIKRLLGELSFQSCPELPDLLWYYVLRIEARHDLLGKNLPP